MQVKILWIEGKRAEGPSFIPNLREKGYGVEIVPTGSAAITRVNDLDPDLVVVNAASLRTSGKRICKSLREQVDGLPILVIADSEHKNGSENYVNDILILPFTLRKLINRIEPFLPWEDGLFLQVGPICLNVERNLVRIQDRVSPLTPRLTHMLKIFLEHPGEAIERERLFQEVWKTKYIEDTRVLDVHISWLRRAIEENPRTPQFLKTIRGMGYRLDVEEKKKKSRPK